MPHTHQIATHLRGVFFGGNWTTVNLKETLADVAWQQAAAETESSNSIVTLVYHMGYYLGVMLKVLGGGPLEGTDKDSFDHPPVESAEDWERLTARVFTDAESLAAAIEAMPESMLWETMVKEQYGNFYRNIHGIIEHTHYHLGQIVLLKKKSYEV